MKQVTAIFIGLLFVLLLLEIVFRFLPVSDRVEIMPVNESSPYLHFRPSAEYRITQGNLFQIRAHKRTNNEGFFSDVDFVEGDTMPKVAVIGDSFVEAVQVENRETIHARLDSLFPAEWKVYGIGSSGSALPQYLAYARYALQRLKPRALVFVIYQNDFLESIAGKSPVAGHHYFSADGSVSRIDRPAESFLRRLVFRSAFFRYLWLNVKLPRFFQRNPAGKKDHSNSHEYLTNNIIRSFIDNLVEVSEGIPVWVITDAPRPAVYGRQWEDARTRNSVYRLYGRLRSAADSAGFNTIDLAPVFRRDYLLYRERFEFPTDGHWNTRGHRLAAEALAGSMMPVLCQKSHKK